MPQGRRKTPFSGKAKKEQLKSKKQSKNFDVQHVAFKKTVVIQSSDKEESTGSVKKINCQPTKSGQSHSNRYALQFHQETDDEIKERKELARQCLKPVSEKELEIDINDYFFKHISFPKRPAWSFDMTLDELNSKENRYFTQFVGNLEKECNIKEISYFEYNLETWRQLWRVLEMSDVLLVIVDIRFPALMFPPSLYEHVTQILKKDLILVLNKIDLVPAPLVAAWKNYFNEYYPQLHVLMFTTLPGYNLVGKTADKAGLQVRRRKGRLRMAAEGTQLLYEVCKSITGDEVDLTSWQEKIKEEMSQEDNDEDAIEIGEKINVKKVDTAYFEHEKFTNGVLTIGCLGQPNVGKSSLINALMGKKVVSVSRTPGHTKHFQTIFLTPTVRLCDCPGLVFPSKVPKTLQILMGSFPIAQLREPFTAVKYLAERLDLPKLLRIHHPENDTEWSAMDVCDGWAKKRGFLTAKAARLDSYRAANHLLRMALDGKISLSLRPPGFFEKREFWKSHPDIETVKWIQARSTDVETAIGEAVIEVSDYSEDEVIESGASDRDKVAPSKTNDASSDSSDDTEPIPFGTNKFAVLDNCN